MISPEKIDSFRQKLINSLAKDELKKREQIKKADDVVIQILSEVIDKLSRDTTREVAVDVEDDRYVRKTLVDAASQIGLSIKVEDIYIFSVKLASFTAIQIDDEIQSIRRTEEAELLVKKSRAQYSSMKAGDDDVGSA